MSNSDNPKKGADFQKQVMDWFLKEYGPGFEMETKIPIGNPAKDHKFDIVNLEKRIVIECKCYTWTETGNVPSAKMGFANEAAFYLSFLPETYEKYIVMLKSHHTSTALFKWLHFLLMSPRLPFQRDQYHPGSISNDILLVPD